MTDGPVPWNAIIEHVRAGHPQLYRAWFADLPAGTIEGGEFRIVVADPVHAAYLQNDCTTAFSNAFMRATGRLIPVRFLSAAAEARPLVRTQVGARLGPLNPDYTFEQFVVGPSNRLAQAACRAVCVQPGAVYNPLFIHGPSGTGKTHLLQAVCSHFERGGESRAIYLSCESFVNEFIRAIETGGLAAFRDSIRHAEVLAIDDVQFIAGRESSQEELFHTFNVLHQSRRQIVLSADLPPAEIPTLEERLVSRFKWGLVVQVGMPDRETRHAILAKKARLRGAEVPDEILDLVAEHVSSNVRALEGALTKLISETTLGGKPMSIDTARQILAEVEGGGGPRLLQVPDIIELVARHFGLKPADLIGRKRSRSVAYPRQIAIYLARKLTPLSLEEIGSYFGGRDHSTVLHATNVTERDREHERQLADTLAVLTRTLLAKR